MRAVFFGFEVMLNIIQSVKEQGGSHANVLETGDVRGPFIFGVQDKLVSHI